VHLPEWLLYDRVSMLGAIMIVAGALLLVTRALVRMQSIRHEGVEDV
jgi:hypothetical protein